MPANTMDSTTNTWLYMTPHPSSGGNPVNGYGQYTQTNTATLPQFMNADLSAAVQHVDPKYWNKLGFKWQNKFYLFACLPFGCRASPYLFNVLAQGLEYMAINSGMSSTSCHYLDDTFTCHSTREKCQQSIDTFNETARLAGFTLQPEKCQEMEFLGIQINTVNSTLSISK